MFVVYVAGPYRAPTQWQVQQNIRKAEGAALELWRLGAAVICPHKNTENFGGAADDSIWLLGDLELLRRSDAVFCIDGWHQSEGATAEVEMAKNLGIPTFESLSEFRLWLNSHQ